VLQPYVQALQAATESHTACLLVQEDVMLTYRIEAAASHSASVRTTGTFETEDALLSASMTQAAVTVQSVGRTGIEPARLGYYDDAVPDLEQVALAPVPTPSAASTYFLVLDATDTHLDHSRTKKLITRFADLLGLLIESELSPDTPDGASTVDEAEDEATAPRPRREIIAEEIEAAQRTSSPLALALVHLNRAEELAQESEAVIADTESALRTRLEQSAPRSRVERFGELTYGVFYNGDVADVEPWAERLQDKLERAGGMLEGGVSIGVAMVRAEAQSPDQLREDATEALRMAYETGTCTIVE
jgi:GGDEF domain-containing protein